MWRGISERLCVTGRLGAFLIFAIVAASSASNPGEVGYFRQYNPGGLPTGYRVDAVGVDGDEIFLEVREAL